MMLGNAALMSGAAWVQSLPFPDVHYVPSFPPMALLKWSKIWVFTLCWAPTRWHPNPQPWMTIRFRISIGWIRLWQGSVLYLRQSFFKCFSMRVMESLLHPGKRAFGRAGFVFQSAQYVDRFSASLLFLLCAANPSFDQKDINCAKLFKIMPIFLSSLEWLDDCQSRIVYALKRHSRDHSR
jgi:hypothetical protein